MFRHSINKGLAIACLLSIVSITFIASAHRQHAQGASRLGSLAATRFTAGKVFPARTDPCPAVTMDRYDNIYALLKRARSEAAADVGNPKLVAPHALNNQNALDSALTQLQSTRALWMSTYAPGGGVLNAAGAYQIFTTLESVTPFIMNGQHWALTEASQNPHTPNHGHASFDFESQAIVIASQMMVDAGRCYMAGYE